jgi:hypothetical protein
MRRSKDDLTPPLSYARMQIGSALATVVLTLSNGVYTFSSAPCAIVSPSTGVRCTAPPGVGMGHAVTLTVDGVTSDPLPNRTLAYAAPSLTTIVASVGADGQGADGVGTEGGTTVVITGLVSCACRCDIHSVYPGHATFWNSLLCVHVRPPCCECVVGASQNLGPAGLTPPSLGAVTYSPSDFALASGIDVRAFDASPFCALLLAAHTCTPCDDEEHVQRLFVQKRVHTCRKSCRGALVGLGGMHVICVPFCGPCPHLAPSRCHPTPFTPAPLLCLGWQVAFVAVDCAISRDHVEVTCSMGPGVGGRLQWSVTVADQSSTIPLTAYRRPVLTLLAVGADYNESSGSNSNVSQMQRQLLSTSGGDVLVFLGDYFGPAGVPLPIVATGRQIAGAYFRLVVGYSD